MIDLANDSRSREPAIGHACPQCGWTNCSHHVEAGLSANGIREIARLGQFEASAYLVSAAIVESKTPEELIARVKHAMLGVGLFAAGDSIPCPALLKLDDGKIW